MCQSEGAGGIKLFWRHTCLALSERERVDRYWQIVVWERHVSFVARSYTRKGICVGGFVIVCILRKKKNQKKQTKQTHILKYMLPSVCIHTVIWINCETWAGSPTTSSIIQGAFAENSITWRIHSYPPQALPVSIVAGERQRKTRGTPPAVCGLST